MGTPSAISRNLLRQPFIPLRRDEIVALAARTREEFKNCPIDEVARREKIILQRIADERTEKAGFCCILDNTAPKPIASKARPGETLFSFAEKKRNLYPAIIINPARTKFEQEVFWHEYYHLYYSPSRKIGAVFFGGYSTAGVLDKQEERRADLFAAFVLIPTIEKDDTIETLTEKFGVSYALANIRLNSQ
ncbi:MAG TPA: hypothetical protein VEW28_02100 [Candidatus Kapabacteria bacterium]|nr:hypothetical protein [Candidatus Kapabacteria bacterium]HYM36045.1 hypothetical protein [Steroidobacteraceae bacterium]